MNKTILQTQKTSRQFFSGGEVLQIIDGVDFKVTAGQTMAIVGASGSGKSTFLHLLGGLDKPSSGQVLWHGENIWQWNSYTLGLRRNQTIGFVYQFHHLMADLTAAENVALPLWIRRVPYKEAQAKALEMLAEVSLSQRSWHYPAQLSGGEKQRVALARALITEPHCILADEPTGNLDSESAKVVFHLLLQKVLEKNIALVVVTHDMSLAFRCEHQFRLNNGKFEHER